MYVVAAAAAILPGPTWAWLWAATVAATAWTGEIIWRNVGLWVAALATVIMGLWPLAVGGGQTESFAALPAAAAFFSAVSGRWTRAGILAGVALLFSFQTLAVLAGLAMLAGARRSAWLSLVTGPAIIGFAVALVFTVFGGLSEAIDVLWTYNRIYLGSDRTGDLHRIGEVVIPLLPLAILLPLRHSRLTRMELAAAAWLVVAIGLLLMQGRLLPHYVIPLAVPLAVLANDPLGARFARLAALAIGAVVLAFGVADSLLSYGIDHRGPATQQIASWVRTATDSNDQILDWGADANIYLASGRAPAGRYPYLIPLVTPSYVDREMVDAWVSDLASMPPKLIIDSEAANPFWVDDQDFLRPPPPGTAGGRNVDMLDPFRTFVRERYSFAAEIAGRKIYVLR